MDKFLFLSHLPQSYSDHPALEPFRLRTLPPTPPEIENAICSHPEAPEIPEVCRQTLRWAQNEAERTKQSLQKSRIRYVTYWCENYPESLRAIADPPWILFFIGQLPEKIPSLAIVGTRKPNSYGVSLVSQFLPRINVPSYQVVSGLAYGIDSLAHYYACEAKIPNFAVLGCGLNTVYPSDHANLALRIVEEGGGILSELSPDTKPLARNFPRRNRIISGLSDVIWIVQGTAKSGSYHTARHALGQDKVIAAAPGDVFNELSDVPHRLIFEGAQPIVRPADLSMLLVQAAEKYRQNRL